MEIITDERKIEELLGRGVEEVIVREGLEKKLMSGKKLRIKFGIDPTGSVLHLGHAVVLRKLRELQDLGHQVIFLIGDFTARIGDPTGKASTRKMMTDDEIRANMKTYVEQAGMILDMSKVEVRYNSEWLKDLGYGELIELTSKVTFAQVARRADFQERIKNDVDLSLQEFMYPVMQGYDSVMLKADVEIGGTDQKFNLLMGRQLQKRYDQEPQEVITCPILEGLSGGDKMSKSLNNYISLLEAPREMLGKIMSIPDDLIIKYFILTTRLPLDEIEKYEKQMKDESVNPRDVKMKLAREIVRMYHGEKEAKEAEEYFVNAFSKGETPDEIPETKAEKGSPLVDVLLENKIVSSKADFRRLVDSSAVSVNEEKINDIGFIVNEDLVVKVGKRRFIKIIIK